jgi:protease-4
VLTRSVENVYATFVNHVATGRKMTFAQVDSIGQGRVWSGIDAKNIGLIDSFGGLDKAIETAAVLAKLKNYRVTKLPEMKDPFTQIMEQISGDYKEDAILKSYLGEQYVYFQKVRDLKDMQGIQARMPFEIGIR